MKWLKKLFGKPNVKIVEIKNYNPKKDRLIISAPNATVYELEELYRQWNNILDKNKPFFVTNQNLIVYVVRK